MRLAEPLPVDGPAAGVPEGLRSGCDLVFEVNSGRTPLGTRGTGRQRLRASTVFKNADGSEDRPKLDKVRVIVDGGKIDDDPWTWQTVRVPLSKHIPENAVEVKRFIFQILDMPQDGRRSAALSLFYRVSVATRLISTTVRSNAGSSSNGIMLAPSLGD